jgi:hypothetical protein
MLNLIDFERPGTVMQDTSFFSSTIYLYCAESHVCSSGVFFQFPDGARVAMHH